MSRGEFAERAVKNADQVDGRETARLIADVEAVAAAIRSLAHTELASAARLLLLLEMDRDVRGGLDQALASLHGVDAHKPWRRLAAVASELFGALLDVYAHYLALPDLAAAGALVGRNELEVGLARAAADRLLWEQVACREPHPNLWARLGAAVATAVASPTTADQSVGDGAFDHYLRALAFYSAGIDQLALPLIPAVQALARLALPAMHLSESPMPASLYAVRPGAGQPPLRIVRQPAAEDGLWFFSPVRAEEVLGPLADRIERGMLPADPALAGCPPQCLQAAVMHLRRHWSASPPARRYRRHVLDGSLAAVLGFDAFRSVLAGGMGSTASAWSLRDVSRGGIGVMAPATAAETLNVGDLIGLCADEGEAWHLGVVRRIRGAGASGVVVGIETLSLRPFTINVDDGRSAAEVLVCDPLLRGEAVRIAAPINALRPGVPLFLTANGGVQKLRPLDASLTGSEFELRVYQVL